MGWPQETDIDPDNNRCKPCSIVQKSVEEWNKINPDIQVGYQFVPCDGSVVANVNNEDMGCLDHKNRNGQLKVAEFLQSRIQKEIQLLVNNP